MTAHGKRLAAAVVAVIVLAALAVGPYITTALFLLDFADGDNGTRRLLGRPRDVSSRDLEIPTRHGSMAARLYTPAGPRPPAVVVFPGVHGGGVDAPRLARLCHRLAASGLTVVCVPVPDLREFRITDRSTDMMEDATQWIAGQDGIAGGRRVTLVGVSFAGGLALVAAGRPSLRGALRAVVSIGGHGDLTRTLRFMTTGFLPDGTRRQPHDYGLAVVALTMARRLVPEGQVDAFEHAVRTFLEASLDDSANRPTARRLIEDLRTTLPTLPEPSRSLVTAVVNRDVVRVGHAVEPFIEEFGNNPALSPALAPVTDAPVFLLHGSDDNVIPSSETPLTAADLSARGHVPVKWLLTPVLSHARLSTEASIGDLWRLVVFWHRVRRQAS